MGCNESRCYGTSTDDDRGTIVGPAVDDVNVELRFDGGHPRDGRCPAGHQPHPPSSGLAPPHSSTAHQRHRHRAMNVVVEDAAMGDGAAAVLQGQQTEAAFPDPTYEDMMQHHMEGRVHDTAGAIVATTPSGQHASPFPRLSVATPGSVMSPSAGCHQPRHGRVSLLQGSAARIKTSMNDNKESPNYTTITIHHVPTFQRGPPPPSTTSCNIVRYGSYGKELVDETTTPLGSVDRASRRSSTRAESTRASRSVSLQGSPHHGGSLHSSPTRRGGGFVQATFLRSDNDSSAQGDARIQFREKGAENSLATPQLSLQDDAAPS